MYNIYVLNTLDITHPWERLFELFTLYKLINPTSSNQPQKKPSITSNQQVALRTVQHEANIFYTPSSQSTSQATAVNRNEAISPQWGSWERNEGELSQGGQFL